MAQVYTVSSEKRTQRCKNREMHNESCGLSWVIQSDMYLGRIDL